MAERGKVTRDGVFGTAVALADEAGLAAVSMRKVAERLGVEAMSLYHHVANKEAILDGMVDTVFVEVELPQDEPWRDGLHRRSMSMREVLGRHRWAIGLLDSRTNPGPGTLRHHDAVLGCLRAGGFSVAGAAHAFSALDSYVYGYCLQEASLPFESGGADLDTLAGEILQQMGEAFPHLAEMITQHALRPGYRYADEFVVGLDLVLDGLERHRTTW